MTDAGIPMGEGRANRAKKLVEEIYADAGTSGALRRATDAVLAFDRKRTLRLIEDAAEMEEAHVADTPPPAAAGDRSLAEAIARIDMHGLAEAVHNGRFNGPVTESYADEREAGKLYCMRIANSVAAYLAALRTPEPNSGGEGWQDISTAPKDGTLIFVCDTSAREPEAGEAQWSSEQWRCFDFDYGVEGSWPNPTHWRPFPDAPTGKAGS